MLIIFIGIILGIALALKLPINIPSAYTDLLAVGIVAGIDVVVSGVYSELRKSFIFKKFAARLFSGMILAILLSFIGEQLGVQLSFAVMIVFVLRIFENFSKIGQLILQNFEKSVKIKEVEIKPMFPTDEEEDSV